MGQAWLAARGPCGAPWAIRQKQSRVVYSHVLVSTSFTAYRRPSFPLCHTCTCVVHVHKRANSTASFCQDFYTMLNLHLFVIWVVIGFVFVW